jgi:formate C-acetyltransferase
LRSCLIEGCLEKGRDYRNGGPVYNHGQILAEGIADTGDSLYAIKKLVYDEKKYTMSELVEALHADFVGYDKLYHDFKCCDKFGNDIEEVDVITTRALNRFFTVLKRNNTYRGGVFTGGCSTFNRAAGYGMKTAALPNGKRKGEPLLADSIAATPGRDVNGPTAHIKSVLRYHHTDACSGFVFQNKFEKKMFNSEKGRASFIALAKAFFAGGGQQYTITVVSPEDLVDAKKHPENHRNLIVRVGGYSDYFVNLSDELQNNVIERTLCTP